MIRELIEALTQARVQMIAAKALLKVNKDKVIAALLPALEGGRTEESNDL